MKFAYMYYAPETQSETRDLDEPYRLTVVDEVLYVFHVQVAPPVAVAVDRQRQENGLPADRLHAARLQGLE